MIARFSNNDDKNWADYSRSWWYDVNVAIGNTTNPSTNADMISPAFWLVSGKMFKVTRSDDPLHTPLLQTTGNCLGGQSFRHKLKNYGDFRNARVWGYNRCRGRCEVKYGGLYENTDGFQQAKCNGTLQSSNEIGFWCDWSYVDGSVMMIGGGGSSCARADHGIGVTEQINASFTLTTSKFDFGFDAMDVSYGFSNNYSLNLWIN